MKVYQVMTPSPVTVLPHTTFGQLWRLLFKSHVHAIPVVDEQRKLVGMITREDLLRPIYPDYSNFAFEDIAAATDFEELEKKVGELVKVKAGNLMGSRIIFARGDTPILRALSRMITHDIHQLPVLTEEGILVGVITKGDIFNALFRENLVRHARKILHKTHKKTKK